MAFQIVQIVYWLSLATWFGGVLFIAIAAPIIFRTVREHNPILSDVLSVNLEGQHGTLLAGSIVSNLLQRLSQIQLICATALLVAMGAQFFLVDLSAGEGFESNQLAAGVRVALWALATGIALYDRFTIAPAIRVARAQYIDNADEPDIANPARDRFDQHHHRSVTLLTASLAVLLMLIVYSSNITPREAGSVALPPAALSE